MARALRGRFARGVCGTQIDDARPNVGIDYFFMGGVNRRHIQRGLVQRPIRWNPMGEEADLWLKKQ
jgi:hypothetical protein